jgi:hypothetical protein
MQGLHVFPGQGLQDVDPRGLELFLAFALGYIDPHSQDLSDPPVGVAHHPGPPLHLEDTPIGCPDGHSEKGEAVLVWQLVHGGGQGPVAFPGHQMEREMLPDDQLWPGSDRPLQSVIHKEDTAIG